MTFVRSFADFYPPKRFDGDPFTQAAIEESAEEGDGFAVLETIALDPLDTDPESPQARNLTTTLATLDPGWYRITWTDASSASFRSAPIYFASPNTSYATATELRAKLKVTAEMLPDTEAAELIVIAEDLIDERLGVRPIMAETGRKVAVADIEGWRAAKLAGATVEIAAAIFSDPGMQSRQRARFSSGDVSVSGFYGPAYGEHAAALLNQSGLVRNTARMSGGTRRRCR